MKIRLIFPLALFSAILIAALATGSSLLLLIAIIIGLSVLFSLASVLWAASTIKISVQYSDQTIRRGEDTSVILQIQHHCLLPIAPVQLKIPSMIGYDDREIRLRDMPGRIQNLRMPIHAKHVGVFSSGIRSCTVEDLLGIFQVTKKPENTIFTLTVLPQTFRTEPLKMAPGDPGSEIMARATEDLNAPSDIRSYQPGDAMKKIHWKLSLRKRELIVRKFDEPVLQDVLILPDCSPPPCEGHPEKEADTRDAILETAASLFTDQLKTGHPVRMPLPGNHPAEADRSSGAAIAFDYLAHVDFSAVNRFERILQMESRNLRKVGCVAVVSARLNYAMVDIMIRIHRSGPNLRLYYITFIPDEAGAISMITRLKEAGIEVSYVTPETTEYFNS